MTRGALTVQEGLTLFGSGIIIETEQGMWLRDLLPDSFFPLAESDVQTLFAIREWARKERLLQLGDEEGYVVSGETEKELQKFFSPDDGLKVALQFVCTDVERFYAGEGSGGFYMEMPFVPVRSLIRRQVVVQLIWWKRALGRIEFEFWLEEEDGKPGPDMLSITTSPKLIERFMEWEHNILKPEEVSSGAIVRTFICPKEEVLDRKEWYGENFIAVVAEGKDCSGVSEIVKIAVKEPAVEVDCASSPLRVRFIRNKRSFDAVFLGRRATG